MSDIWKIKTTIIWKIKDFCRFRAILDTNVLDLLATSLNNSLNYRQNRFFSVLARNEWLFTRSSFWSNLIHTHILGPTVALFLKPISLLLRVIYLERLRARTYKNSQLVMSEHRLDGKNNQPVIAQKYSIKFSDSMETPTTRTRTIARIWLTHLNHWLFSQQYYIFNILI